MAKNENLERVDPAEYHYKVSESITHYRMFEITTDRKMSDDDLKIAVIDNGGEGIVICECVEEGNDGTEYVIEEDY